MKNVVVTGVSSGVGWGIAKILTQTGIRVFGSIRSTDDGQRLSRELGKLFIPLYFDVTDQEAINQAVREVTKYLDNERLDALINNAGISIHGPLLYQPIIEFSNQIDVNLMGAVRVSKAFLPLLGTDQKRRRTQSKILNISSMGGEIGVPILSAYSASKFALKGFSESLRRELLPFDIDVIVINPGAIKTKIFDKASNLDLTRYQNTVYGKSIKSFVHYLNISHDKALSPEAVGKLVLKVIWASKPKTKYSIMRSGWLIQPLIRCLPSRWIDFLFAHTMQLKPYLTEDPEATSSASISR